MSQDRTDFVRIGTVTLTAYYERELKNSLPTVATEYSFADRQIHINSKAGNITITGVLDRIELLNKVDMNVRIIDYKTGRARSRNEIEGKTARADADYKRQLIFYQLLTDIDRNFPYRVKETALAFIDDDHRFTKEIFVISPDEVTQLTLLIEQVYQRMLDLDFHHIDNPQRPPCEYCHL